MVTVKATGEAVESQFRPNDLRALQDAVGGYIEMISSIQLFEHNGTIHKCVVFCDEEGKLKGKPINREATTRWNRGLAEQGVSYNPDYLVGDVAFIFGDPKLMAEL
jgi:hypothetical protein